MTTTTTRRRKATEEQRAAAAEKRAAFRAMSKQLADMTEEQRCELVARAGRIVTIEGRPLSVKNTLLVAFQSPSATVIGGFNQWRAAGRMVRKGEHGFGIWAPTSRKTADGETEEERAGFVMVTMFDISQTDEREVCQECERAECRGCPTPSAD